MAHVRILEEGSMHKGAASIDLTHTGREVTVFPFGRPAGPCRIEPRRVRRAALVMALLVVGAATGHAQESESASNETRAFDIVIGPGVATDASGNERPVEYQSAWLVYATARGAALAELQQRQSSNRSADDFLIEYRGREQLARFWQEARQDAETEADAYLDKLVEIVEAGYLGEYVIFAFGRPGWTVPADYLGGFDPRAFGAWWQHNVGTMDSPTHALAELKSGPRWPDEPGATLPNPEQYYPTVAPCDESLRPMRAGVERWLSEAQQLDGEPVAAEDSAAFILQIAAVAGSEPYMSRGATWVLQRPADLAFLAGFCAIETADFELARDMLQVAVALQPLNGSARSELAHAFVSLGELDRADEIVAQMISLTDDPCLLGRAWRRRGFVRFEQGKLEEARQAYRTSLQFDPRSEVARSELELLDAEIVGHGGEPSNYTAPEIVPATTQCESP